MGTRAKIRKKNVNPCKPEFYYIKVGFTRVTFTQTYYPDDVVTKCDPVHDVGPYMVYVNCKQHLETMI